LGRLLLHAFPSRTPFESLAICSEFAIRHPTAPIVRRLGSLLGPGGFRPQVPEEAVERLLKRVVIFPPAEIRRYGAFAECRRPGARAVHHRVVEPYRKQHGCAMPLFFPQMRLNLALTHATVDGNSADSTTSKAVMELDGFSMTSWNLSPIFRSALLFPSNEPACALKALETISRQKRSSVARVTG